MKMLATILAARVWALTMAAPHQYSATKFQANGPLTTGMWMNRGVLEWLKYAEERLKKLMINSNSASQKKDRTPSADVSTYRTVSSRSQYLQR
jgi:hypothetical protein